MKTKSSSSTSISGFSNSSSSRFFFELGMSISVIRFVPRAETD